MDDDDSTAATRRSCNYHRFLQNIDKLSKLATDADVPDDVSRNTSDTAAIEEIVNQLTIDIQRMDNSVESESNEENFKKNAMCCVSLLNTIIRISVMARFNDAISRKPFRSMFARLITKLEDFIPSSTDRATPCPIAARDIFNSIFLNLAKDNLLETCFNRLLSNGTLNNKGKVVASFTFLDRQYKYIGEKFGPIA